MKEVNKETLKIAAEKLLFDMEDSEYETLLNEFHVIIKQLELMDNIEDLSTYSPLSFPYVDESFSLLRDDEVIEETLLNKEEILANAKEVRDGQIELPKVVG